MRKVYLLLAIAGLALPYYFFISFLAEHGLDPALLVEQLFVNDISTFFAIDLVLTALVFLAFSDREARAGRVKSWWVYRVATLVVGPSFAFPLFLYLREGSMVGSTSARRRSG
ncbi:MAG: DUF2834 domain-containing protein [Anaerolineae bacterium]|jgi:hypothetical protein